MGLLAWQPMKILRLHSVTLIALLCLCGTLAAAAETITQEVVKKFITQREEKDQGQFNGGKNLKSISFESVQFGTSRKALPGELIRVPAGTTIYPVRVKYTTHRAWPANAGAPEAVTIHWTYDFYKDEYGEWTGASTGPVR